MIMLFWPRCLFSLFPFAAVQLAIPLSGSSGFAVPTVAWPDILFIPVDDLGWRGTTVYGSTFYRTPNVECLAPIGVCLQPFAAGAAKVRTCCEGGFWK